MRILLSAYACDPTRGSEPGVGWNWALELQRQGNAVTVLTRVFMRPRIEKFYRDNPNAPRPVFVYYELSKPLLRSFQAGFLPEQIYYLLWQIFCVGAARKAAHEHACELAWHLTLGTIRLPSFLWRLGKPFVYGPAGGAERAPYAMRTDYPLYGHVKDNLRDALNWLSRIDPTMRAVFAKADLIFARTTESANLVPRRWRDKVKIVHEVGVVDIARPNKPRTASQVLFAGGFHYFKGITLAVRAFAEFVRLGGVARFTLVGLGPEEPRARLLAQKLGVAHLIDWVPWVEKREMSRFYEEHDVFLFPSLHDSGGTVVVEAMSHGLPVLCFDLGGPGLIVSKEAGIVQSTRGRTAHEAARELGNALKRLFDDPAEVARLSEGALARAQEFLWSSRVAFALAEIKRAGIL